jgi:glyoxylase-like metal-dependent hydrolase (beta-lactamase superfamily II)
VTRVRAFPPRLDAAGWTITLVDTGAIRAPVTWVDPSADESTLEWFPSGGLVCRRAETVLLVDCGFGPFREEFSFEVRPVELRDALASAGVTSGDVTLVVLTHLDSDHAGGLVERDDDGALRTAFGQTPVCMLDSALPLLDGTGAERWEPEASIGAALRAHDVDVRGLPDGAEIVEGVRLRSAPGHREGHACVELTGNGEIFVHLADVIDARAHVAHPEWNHLHDGDRGLALATRRALLEELAGTGTVVSCAHVDGFGRIERDGAGGLIWVDAS